MVLKFEDVIGSIKFQYWNTTAKTKTYHSKENQYKDWYPYDTRNFGRCFTLTPSVEDTQYGIKVIELQLLAESTIFTHTKGILLKGTQHQILLRNRIDYDIVYAWEAYDLLDYGGDVCNNDKDYSKDLCLDAAIQKELLSKIGCTDPFGPNRTHICTKQYEGRKANEIISAAKENPNVDCYHPCNFSSITLSELTETGLYGAPSDEAMVRLHFSEIIKVSETYYTYSPLSMIAEIGGYVGLFLGVSVNMVTNLLDIFIAKLERLHGLFNI